MIDDKDIKDRNESRKILIALTSLLLILFIFTFLFFPSFVEVFTDNFDSGLGLKGSAIISFFVTIVLLLVLTMVSGDGLIGEIQFVLPAFFVFFIIIWLLIAWVF